MFTTALLPLGWAMAVGRPPNGFLDPARRHPLVAGERMPVEIDCGADLRMAETLLRDHDAAILPHAESAGGMPEVVETDVREPGPLQRRIEEPLYVARL